MSPLAGTLLACLALCLGAMVLLWLLGTLRHNVSLVDPFWGTGFVLVAWLAWLLNRPASPRFLLLAGLVTLWGLRLSLYLLWRNWRTAEDRRYAAMRARYGPSFRWISLLTVFLAQGWILWFVSLPMQVAAVAKVSAPLGWLAALGIAGWSLGMFFEAVGDWQLARFQSDPNNAGRVLDRGLWQFTRHPNYFGDCCVWWGLYLIAAAGGAWWTIASPLLMTILLLKVSGVTLLESTIADRRPEYRDYQERTNAFIPWPNKFGKGEH